MTTSNPEAKIPEKVFNFQESRFWQKKAGRNRDMLHMEGANEVPMSQRDKITNRSESQVKDDISQNHHQTSRGKEATMHSAGKSERRTQKNATCHGILPSGPEHPPRVTKRQVSEQKFSAPFATTDDV